ncbi:hypothetical protein ACFTZI_09860 [Streptomyces decoyicus]
MRWAGFPDRTRSWTGAGLLTPACSLFWWSAAKAPDAVVSGPVS